MKIDKYFKHSVLSIACMACALSLSSCVDDIEIGKGVDEGAYDAATRVDGMLLDRATNQNQSIVELRDDSHTTDIYFRLSQAPAKGVDVKVELDAEYLAKYNAEHETNFELYPTDLVTLDHDGVLLLAPDENTSVNIGVNIKGSETLQADVTYAIPLKATSSTEGVTFSSNAERAILLVKDYRSQADCYKGKDAVKNVLYFEVNDTNPLNALEFVIKENGKLFFDEIVLFAANINYNREAGRVYLNRNPNVQFLLDNNEKYLQPLRKRGMKVYIGVLGNHDEAGVAQLSYIGAKMFAQELAAYCYAYNLDGVSFDDEYSNSPDYSNPLLGPCSIEAASRLFYETKCAMPDKSIMIYYWGSIWSNVSTIDGISPSEFIDVAVADYGGAASPVSGMSKKRCAGMSIELNLGRGDDSEYTARNRKNDGYGYYMFFALDPGKYASQIYRCQNVCRGLYDATLLAPTHYYKKNDATRYPR